MIRYKSEFLPGTYFENDAGHFAHWESETAWHHEEGMSCNCEYGDYWHLGHTIIYRVPR